MSKKLRILNAFAGIGGNRLYWDDIDGVDVEVTAVEFDPAIAEAYKSRFPNDTVIVGDTKQYLLDHYKEFDFIWASPPCFVGTELVLTTRGHIKIRDVRVGDYVLTHLGRWKPVEKIGRKHQVSIKEIKTIGVDSIRCTFNHPFYSREKKDGVFSEPKWVNAEDMADKFCASITKVNEKINNQNIISPYFIGRWLGDGWVRQEHTTNKNDVLLCCGKHEVDELESELKKMNFNFIKSEQRTSYRFVLSDKNIVDYLVYNFGRGAGGKKIAGWVFSESSLFRSELLRGYLDADGHFAIKRNIWRVGSISRSLIYGVELLSQTLGYKCTISKPKLKKTCKIEGRTVNQNQQWILSIGSRNTERTRQFVLDDDIEYTKVKSVKTIGWNSYVYDIQVADDNSYTVNNKIVHNCQTHTQIRLCGVRKGDCEPVFPDMSLWEMIIFLNTYLPKHTKFVVENVRPFYKPLILPSAEIDRHLYWSNFPISEIKIQKDKIVNEVKIADFHKLELKDTGIKNKIQVVRNQVNYETGKHILECALNKTLHKQGGLF